MEQLRDLIARIMSRRLDRNRPLWETYLVEGLEGGRYAVLVQVTPGARRRHHGRPRSADRRRQPDRTRDARHQLDPGAPARRRRAAHRGGERLGPQSRRSPPTTCAVSSSRPATPPTGSGRWPGRHRRPSTRRSTGRARCRALGAAPLRHGRDAAVGLPQGPQGARRQRQRRRARHHRRSTARLAPDARRGGHGLDPDQGDGADERGRRRVRRADVARQPGHAAPVDPARRRGQPGHAAAPGLVRVQGAQGDRSSRRGRASWPRSPASRRPRSTRIGARVAASHSPRSFDLVITNVPGPQFPLYAAGAQHLASYPVLPLLPGHALAIGVTSYDGKVFYGLDADRDAMPDLDVLGQLHPRVARRAGRRVVLEPRSRAARQSDESDRDPDVHDAETSRQARRDQEDCRHEG